MPQPRLSLTHRSESGRRLPMLVWRFIDPVRAIASGPLGGGIGARHWVINATVDKDYTRLDPETHLRELAAECGLVEPGAGMLTAVDVGAAVTTTDGGVWVVATVGLGHPTLAADEHETGDAAANLEAAASADDSRQRRSRSRPGTINIVASIPAALTDAALVNTVATVTEAKSQALWECGVEATGTASDAVCVASEMPGGDAVAEPFGGPRSTWGARLARAVHAAVIEGAGRWSGPPGQAGHSRP